MIRNILTNFSVRLTVAAMNFLIMLLTLHTLGMETRGEISTLMIATGIIHLISDLACGPALVYLVPRKTIPTLMTIGVLWSIVSTLITGYVINANGLVPAEYSIHTYIIGFLLSIHSLNLSILLGQERIRELNFVFLLQGVLMFAVFGLSVYGFHLAHSWPYIYGAIVSYGVCSVIGFAIIPRRKQIELIEEKRPLYLLLISNGAFTQAASLGLSLGKSRNFELLKHHMPDGLRDVGSFSTAFALSEAILLLSASICTIILARVANTVNPDEQRRAVMRFSKFSFVITAFAVLVFALLPEKFYAVLLGKESGDVKTIFISLCPGTLILAFASVYAHFYSGAGKYYMNFISSVLAYGFIFLFAGKMLDLYGIKGPGYSTSISYGLLAAFIVFCFLLRNRGAGDWKALLPSKDDLVFMKKFMSKNSGK